MKLDCDDCEKVLSCRRDEFYDDDANSCPDFVEDELSKVRRKYVKE